MATAAATGGLGLGPLVAGFFAELAPNPTVLVFQVHFVLLAVAAVGLAMVPETVVSRRKLDLRFAGFRVPESARRQFLAAAAAGFAALALLGLFTALAPSFLRGVLHVRNLAVGGALVFLIFAASTAAQIMLGRYPTQSSTRLGLGLYVGALALIVGALRQSSLTMFVAGTIVGGVAVGAAFIGSLSCRRPTSWRHPRFGARSCRRTSRSRHGPDHSGHHGGIRCRAHRLPGRGVRMLSRPRHTLCDHADPGRASQPRRRRLTPTTSGVFVAVGSYPPSARADRSDTSCRTVALRAHCAPAPTTLSPSCDHGPGPGPHGSSDGGATVAPAESSDSFISGYRCHRSRPRR